MSDPIVIHSPDAAGHELVLTVLGNSINKVIVRDISGKELGNLSIDVQVALIQAIFTNNPAIYKRFTGRDFDFMTEIIRLNQQLDKVSQYIHAKSFIGNEADLDAMIQQGKTLAHSPLLKP